MTYQRNIVAQIARLGQKATVRVRSESGKNAFNNPTDSYTDDRTVQTLRTYPNRNTEIEGSTGPYHSDNPVFLVPKGDQHPAPPGEEDRLKYNGKEYEVKAFTEYQTHVEFFGERVNNG